MDNSLWVKGIDLRTSQIFRLIIYFINVTNYIWLKKQKNGFHKLSFPLRYHCFGSNTNTNHSPKSGVVCPYKSEGLTWWYIFYRWFVFVGIRKGFLFVCPLMVFAMIDISLFEIMNYSTRKVKLYII